MAGTEGKPTMSTNRHSSRRRSPRLDPMGLVTCELFTGQPEVNLLDLSPEGFAVESSESFKVGTRHHFSFRSETANGLITSAQVVASLKIDGGAKFKTSFKFSTMDNATKKAVEQLMETVTSPLTFY